jgi:hypothetical protein
MKLPIKVLIKIKKTVKGVKPTFSKAMLTAPIKTNATTANAKTSNNAKKRKLC